MAHSLCRLLNQDFRQASKILAKALLGEAESDERWRECVADTDGSLGFATGAMFVRQAFNEDARAKGEFFISSFSFFRPVFSSINV